MGVTQGLCRGLRCVFFGFHRIRASFCLGGGGPHFEEYSIVYGLLGSTSASSYVRI